MTTRPDVRLTPEEYLRIERAAEWKSEYIDGEMFAMSGASHRHTIITSNLVRVLGNHLLNGPCTVSSADLRVATDRRRHYTYPDVVVVCDPPQYVDDQLDTVTNPTLIAEVLSDSTEKYDRGGKFERYRSLQALSDYMLVAQDRIHVELFTRQPDGRWSLREWNDPAAEIDIESLHCRLNVAEVYAKVSFDVPERADNSTV
jgi:Uma2 family endonuclease